MFNISQKDEFIDYMAKRSSTVNKEKLITDWINLFNRLEEIEQIEQKDFSHFNYDEIIDLLPLILRKKVSYQRQTLSNLKIYVTWTIENGYSLDSENRLIGMKPSDIDFSKSCAECMVKDEQQLKENLDIILRDLVEDTNDNMYRLMFHLLFNGVPFKEVFDLKIDNVDFENSTLTFKQNKINISPMCLSLIKYAQQMDVIKWGTSEKKSICKDGYVLENTSTERDKMPMSAKSFSSLKLGELKQHLNNKVAITLNTLFRSGELYRIYCEEQKGNVVELDSETLLEYETWKKVFEL